MRRCIIAGSSLMQRSCLPTQPRMSAPDAAISWSITLAGKLARLLAGNTPHTGQQLPDYSTEWVKVACSWSPSPLQQTK